ncbi:MAG: glutathione S-transferase family protein [Pseudomonadota bacterium]
MGMLVAGQWQHEDIRRTNAQGEFVRERSPYRAWLGDSQHPAEAGRYHLFVNAGCPWAYRTLLYRALKGLDKLISISYTQPAMGSEGWTFGEQREPQLQARHMHDVYRAADGQFTGRVTVPVLWDKQARTIVNNESADIIRMFNTAFDSLPGVVEVDYYPAEHAAEIDRLNERIYSDVNNGVYRCGFARSQQAYDTAFDTLFRCLDELDERLAEQRFLCGERITEADWRLFATLVRFDAAYYGQFRCNRNRLSDFPNLWPYTRDLYQQPRVAATVDLVAIKGIYYGGRPPHIIPKGPQLDFAQPHGRD